MIWVEKIKRVNIGRTMPETVEKVPFQRLIIEKHLVFYVSNNNLAIFEPVMGVFVKIFQTKGFSTVSLGADTMKSKRIDRGP